MKKLFFFMFAAALISACSMDNDPRDPGEAYPDPAIADDVYSGEGGYEEGGSNGQGEAGQSGMVTAGEWRDLDNWLFWSSLMTEAQPDQTGFSYSEYNAYWGLYTNNRVAVRVKDENGSLQRDVPVQLMIGSSVLYEARTDNKGETNLFVGLTQLEQSVDAQWLELVVNGVPQTKQVNVTAWGDSVVWNECLASVTPTTNIDIAFFVDATGSMMDEISFLKADLTDIIQKVQAQQTSASIRTAALFYRDEGDDYVTKVNDFSSNLSTTVSFIAKQNADGGGDYPEAVHTAFETGLQQLSWREENSIRLAFLLLDAPPHHQEDVIASLQRSIPQYAKRGIRIIPVAASGVDKPTEFFLRYTAIATDGTYVFLTNHSGIGGEHIQATVGEYQVELLNDLIVRLINQYLE